MTTQDETYNCIQSVFRNLDCLRAIQAILRSAIEQLNLPSCVEIPAEAEAAIAEARECFSILKKDFHLLAPACPAFSDLLQTQLQEDTPNHFLDNALKSYSRTWESLRGLKESGAERYPLVQASFESALGIISAAIDKLRKDWLSFIAQCIFDRAAAKA